MKILKNPSHKTWKGRFICSSCKAELSVYFDDLYQTIEYGSESVYREVFFDCMSCGKQNNVTFRKEAKPVLKWVERRKDARKR